MAINSELKARAWNSLKRSYWCAVLAYFLFIMATEGISSVIGGLGGIITSIADKLFYYAISPDIILGLLFTALVLSIVSFVLTILILLFVVGPFTVGLSKFFIINTEETPSFGVLFAGFKSGYFNIVKTYTLMYIKISLWSLLFIIPGYIKFYEYAMIPYILAENPSISTKKAFETSKILMDGNKWNFFCLQLSFIGWILLSLLTCGIGAYFLAPYQQAAYAEFYKAAKEDRYFLLD